MKQIEIYYFYTQIGIVIVIFKERFGRYLERNKCQLFCHRCRLKARLNIPLTHAFSTLRCISKVQSSLVICELAIQCFDS